MSVIDRIRWQRPLSAPKAALSVPGPYRDTVSYTALNHYIDNASRRMAEAGVVPNAIYGLLIKDPLLHIVMTFALEHLGAASAALPGPANIDGLSLAAVFTDGQDNTFNCPVNQVRLDWLQGNGMAPARVQRSPDALCRVLFTSGSTGKPKAVAYTDRMVADRISRFDYAFGSEFPQHARTMCCMGLASALGYLLCVYLLAKGGMFCIPDSSIEQTARKISIYQIQNLLASPQTMAEFWAMAETEGTLFRPLELVLIAGSLLSPALAESVRTNVCNRVVNVYGSTEAGVVATAPVELLDLENGEVGFVLPNMQVDIVDSKNAVATPLQGGRIRITSPGNVRGYLGASEDPGPFEGASFFPGDHGFLSREGILSIFGRENNIVNIGGIKTTHELIEARYLDAPAVREAAAGIVLDALGIERIVAHIVPADNWSEEAFRAYCQRALAREYWPIRIVLTQRLPRLPTGKIDRRQVTSLSLPS